MLPLKKKLLFWQRCVLSVFCLGLFPTLTARSVLSAEKVVVSYAVLRHSIPINALETGAVTGKIRGALAMYPHYVAPEQVDQLQQALHTRFPLNANQIARLLYTPIGKELTYRLASFIQTEETPQAKAEKIQTALIRAAADADGLSLLNVLRQYPDDEIEIDLSYSLEIIAAVNTSIEHTQQMVNTVNQKAEQEATAEPLPASFVPTELQYQGMYGWEQQTLTLTDRSRSRTFLADLYLPITSAPSPVIVISHGLSSNRFSLAYLAQHLASYGFAVAIPEHPGSNWNQLMAVLEGNADRIAEPQEFIDRPLDVTFLLDELDRRVQQGDPMLKERLNLQQVGVIGQSFGGYTVLALAGAELNFKSLERDCQNLPNALNPSLLLQCQALVLPRRDYDLADPRVKAAIAISPIGSSLLGADSLSQINVPTFLMAGSADLLAPALPEQVQPFTWLTTADKYLAVMQGGTHFSSVSPPLENEVLALPQRTMVNDDTVRRYITILGTAFMQTYVARRTSYRPYLNSAYVSTLSQSSSPLSIVQTLPVVKSSVASTGVSSGYPLIAIGIGTQALGLVYFIAKRDRLPVAVDLTFDETSPRSSKKVS